MEEHERISVMASVAVVILSIAAFITFIYTGGGALFYIVAILALAVGLYTSFRISREAKVANKTAKKPKR